LVSTFSRQVKHSGPNIPESEASFGVGRGFRTTFPNDSHDRVNFWLPFGAKHLSSERMVGCQFDVEDSSILSRWSVSRRGG
jgi:hypothetical protein